MIDVLYFAWVRERVGLPREQVETSAATVADLVEELKARQERYAAAFADVSALRVGGRSGIMARLTRRWPVLRRGCLFSTDDRRLK